MAAGIVGRPPPFLNEPGRPAIPWRQWHRLFETYLVAADCAEFTSQRKAALLKICLGTEAEQIVHIIESTRPARATDVDEYKDLVQSLAARFDDSTSQRANRIQFRNLRQTEAESAIAFARRVQYVGRQCNFGSDEAAALVDQLIVGLASERTRERLLVDDPSLTFDKAIQIIQNVAEVQDLLQQYRTTKGDIVQVVDGTQQRPIQFPRSGLFFARTNRNSPPPTCGRCGRTWHPLQQCPARGKMCFQCGKIGHFGNVCRTSYPAATKSASTSAARHSRPPVRNVEAPTSDEENFVVVNQLGQHATTTCRGFYADIKVNGDQLECWQTTATPLTRNITQETTDERVEFLHRGSNQASHEGASSVQMDDKNEENTDALHKTLSAQNNDKNEENADALHKASSVEMDEKGEDNTAPLDKDFDTLSTTVPSEAHLISPRPNDSLATSQPTQDLISDIQDNEADFEVDPSNLVEQPMMVLSSSQAVGNESQESHHTGSTSDSIAPVPAETSLPPDISISSQAVDIKASPYRVISYDEGNSDTTDRSLLKHVRQPKKMELMRPSRQRRVSERPSCHFRDLFLFHPRHILRPLRRPLQSTLGRPPEIFQGNLGQLRWTGPYCA